jgi:hypothetical protein
MQLDQLVFHFNEAKKKFDRGEDTLDSINATVVTCIRLLKSVKTVEEWPGPGKKLYLVYKQGEKLSRPFLKDQLINEKEFQTLWSKFFRSIDREQTTVQMAPLDISKLIYNIVVPFCVCFDLWKSASRKTPGTFFEVVLGTMIAGVLPFSMQRTKHIQLPSDLEKNIPGALPGETIESVSTDIVFQETGKGLVIPAKITTRERIVQPFAHQRILDSVFGIGHYISYLVCVSETQLSNKGRKVQDICVPGTITLFQKHLAKLGGVYYLDPPERYLALSRAGVINISNIGSLFSEDLAEIVKRLNQIQSE